MKWPLFTELAIYFSVQELALPSDLEVQLVIFFFVFLSLAQQNLFSLE